jgi:hypothetical protein
MIALTSCCADRRYKLEDLLLFLLAELAEDTKIKIVFEFRTCMHWIKVKVQNETLALNVGKLQADIC